MSADSSTAVDVWRMVSARRVLEGELPLAGLSRLKDALAQATGTARYRMEFGRDALGVAFAALHIDAHLPLLCQRRLEVFEWPVQLRQTLGLVRDEAAEAALPPGYEALLVPEDGRVVPSDLVEDELILAIPLIPVSPGSEAMEREWQAQEADIPADHPFAVLAALKTPQD